MAPKTMKKVKTVKKQTKKKSSSNAGPTAIGAALRALGGLGGGALGGMLGNPALGGAAGTGLGAMVSKWLGQGDYAVSTNSLVNRVRASGDIPSMHKLGQSIVVRHKEFIGDLTSSVAFGISDTIVLNPGLVASFPWLSTIAQQYQEYTWKGIVFEFISTSGNVVASTNTALGSIMMATQYRSTAAVYTNKTQLLNEYFSSDAKPSENFCHPIECDPRENPYNVQYVRTGAVPTGEDPKTYDLGTTYVATQGMQAGAVDIGELWVSYEVELRKPIVTGLLDLAGLFSDGSSSTGVTAAAPFGTANTAAIFSGQNNSIGLTMTSTVMTFPIGSIGPYMLTYFINDCTAANLSGFAGSVTNCAANLTYGSTYTVGTNVAFAVTYIVITDPTKIATFTPVITTATGASKMTFRIAQVPGGLPGYL